MIIGIAVLPFKTFMFCILRSKGGTCVFATPTGSYYWMSELCTEEKKFMCSKPTGMIIDFFVCLCYLVCISIHRSSYC
jgi:hypothetical protein